MGLMGGMGLIGGIGFIPHIGLFGSLRNCQDMLLLLIIYISL